MRHIYVSFVRTTLNIDDQLYRALKLRAAETGRTVTQLVDEAIRLALAREQDTDGGAYSFEPAVVKGRVTPFVDVSDRQRLYDIMEGID